VLQFDRALQRELHTAQCFEWLHILDIHEQHGGASGGWI
jgi:hypothetical protein